MDKADAWSGFLIESANLRPLITTFRRGYAVALEFQGLHKEFNGKNFKANMFEAGTLWKAKWFPTLLAVFFIYYGGGNLLKLAPGDRNVGTFVAAYNTVRRRVESLRAAARRVASRRSSLRRRVARRCERARRYLRRPQFWRAARNNECPTAVSPLRAPPPPQPPLGLCDRRTRTAARSATSSRPSSRWARATPRSRRWRRCSTPRPSASSSRRPVLCCVSWLFFLTPGSSGAWCRSCCSLLGSR